MPSPKLFFPTIVLTLTFSIAAVAAPTTLPAPPPPQQACQILRDGDSAARLDLIQRMQHAGVTYVAQFTPADRAALAESAADPSAQMRSALANFIGARWLQRHPAPDADALNWAIDLDARLAVDADNTVRHDAVATGLKWLAVKTDRAVQGLVDSVLHPAQWDDWVAGQAIFGLNGRCGAKVDASRLLPLLEPYWANAAKDPDRAAAAAYVLFVGATATDPPNIDRLNNVGYFCLPIQSRGGASVDDIRAELQRRLPPGAADAFELNSFRGQVGGRLAIRTVAHRRQVVDALRHSHDITMLDDFSQWGGQLLTLDHYQKLVAQCRASAIATSTPADLAAARDTVVNAAVQYLASPPLPNKQ